ncbi:PEP-CTERM sorting domain-containing protein [Horticoccus luteus]|uniref:PEP-CTERM sorting domain-containing protein n=1 Tax=Horticoccus luteus TaxID=2862869 RepID=A0A8F9TWX4_9BACT|nr:PEP-CTERM sorting domain-containing protein [Horticoccus luteus]QYM79339.1 PEP-CTERM sorting domain-containing protein [Horticoccus luteus]
MRSLPYIVASTLTLMSVAVLRATPAVSATTSGNWTSSGTWDNGVPTNTSNVVIQDFNIAFNVGSTTTVHDLSLLAISSGASLTDVATNRTLNLGGTLTLTGTSLSNAASLQVNTVNIQAGGNLTMNAFSSFTANGSVTVAAGATANLNNGATLARTFYNNGTTTQTGTVTLSGATTNNNNGAIYYVSGTSELNTGSLFNKSGALLTKIGGGTSDIKVGVTNQSGGTIRVDDGILQLNSNVSNSGAITVTNTQTGNQLNTLLATVTNKSGGAITVQSGANWTNDAEFVAQAGSTISNAGEIKFNSGNATFEGTTGISGGGVTSFQANSHVAFNGTNSIDNTVTFLGEVGGFNSSGGTVNVNGAATWDGSATNTSTDTTVNFNNNLAIKGHYDASNASNSNTYANATTTLDANKNVITNSTSGFTNTSTGTFNMAHDGSGITGPGTFTNDGQFNKTSAGTNTLDEVAFVNTGNVAVTSGVLQATNGATYAQSSGNTDIAAGATLGGATATFSGGSLSGNGTLTTDGGAFFNSGSTITPGTTGGADIGTLNFGSDVWVSSGANYAIQLLSTGGVAGTDNDTLNISGSLQLPSDGFNLTINSIGTGGLIDGFTDSGNYNWTIASAVGGIVGFVDGTYAIGGTSFNLGGFNLDLSGIGNIANYSGTWSLINDGTNLILNYASFAPVPEPSTYAMIGAGVCGLLLVLRHRQRARLAANSALLAAE